jgi:hypothetical protein
VFDYNQFQEVLDIRTEQSNTEEKFNIEETIRSIFGESVEVIEFEPYDNEGNTTSKRGI